MSAADPARGTSPAPSLPPGAVLEFSPVPVAARQDGWTLEKQRAFIEALADSGSVPAAAKAVGMGVEGAYRLRRRRDAAAFAEAWNTAYGAMTRRLTDAASARAIHGTALPVFFQGELVGERIHYDERMTRLLLERHDPRGHGYLHDSDPSWAAKRDTLAPRLARLPRLLGRLFGMGDDPVSAECASDASPPPARARRRG